MPHVTAMVNIDALAEQIRSIAAGVFGVDGEELPQDASVETYPLWTSLNHIILMASVEEEFGLRLSMEQMKAMTSLESVITFLHGRTAAA